MTFVSIIKVNTNNIIQSVKILSKIIHCSIYRNYTIWKDGYEI